MACGCKPYRDSRIKVMRWYDAIAEGYDELYGEEQKAKFNLTDVKRNGAILDCGCGTGLLLAILPHEPMTVGLDLSEKMLRKAKRKLGGKVHLVQGDALTPPFRSSVFDTVYSFTVMDREQGEALVKVVTDLLKEDGVAVISASKKSFNPKILRGLAEASGLKPLEVVDVEGVKDYVAVCFKRSELKSPLESYPSSPCPKPQPQGR